jgi:hypothetical protein
MIPKKKDKQIKKKTRKETLFLNPEILPSPQQQRKQAGGEYRKKRGTRNTTRRL